MSLLYSVFWIFIFSWSFSSLCSLLTSSSFLSAAYLVSSINFRLSLLHFWSYFLSLSYSCFDCASSSLRVCVSTSGITFITTGVLSSSLDTSSFSIPSLISESYCFMSESSPAFWFKGCYDRRYGFCGVSEAKLRSFFESMRGWGSLSKREEGLLIVNII